MTAVNNKTYDWIINKYIPQLSDNVLLEFLHSKQIRPHPWKFMIVGPSNVGKTQFLLRIMSLANQQFDDIYVISDTDNEQHIYSELTYWYNVTNSNIIMSKLNSKKTDGFCENILYPVNGCSHHHINQKYGKIDNNGVITFPESLLGTFQYPMPYGNIEGNCLFLHTVNQQPPNRTFLQDEIDKFSDITRYSIRCQGPTTEESQKKELDNPKCKILLILDDVPVKLYQHPKFTAFLRKARHYGISIMLLLHSIHDMKPELRKEFDLFIIANGFAGFNKQTLRTTHSEIIHKIKQPLNQVQSELETLPTNREGGNSLEFCRYCMLLPRNWNEGGIYHLPKVHFELSDINRKSFLTKKSLYVHNNLKVPTKTPSPN